MHSMPSHALLYDLARSSRYGERLIPQIRMNEIETTERYVEALTALSCDVDAWETTYFQILHGEDAVLEWTKGSSLRPFTSVLDADEAVTFVEEYRRLLRDAYPSSDAGTVFPFRRVFVVAHRRS
jgi:trans-aconitate 2-methyltransferase